MSGRFREYAWVIGILILCPVLTLFHGSLFAQTADPQLQAEQYEEETSTLNALNVLIDNFSGLSEEEKAQVSQILENELGGVFDNHNMDPGVIIPLAGILFAAFAVTIPVFIVLLMLIFAQRKRKQRFELISKFVENGQAVPKELLVDDINSGAGGEQSNMKRGLLLMGVGIGLIIAIGMLAGWEVGALGMIPFFIGLARFVIWKLEDKSEAVTGDDPLP